VIGSGWLLGALNATTIAGPAAIVSRVIGACAVILLWKIAISAPDGFHGILATVATGGVIFSFQGLEQAVQFGGETADPKRNIPCAVIGSMVVGTVMYVLLQLVFLGG
jgi:amino acid transporter